MTESSFPIVSSSRIIVGQFGSGRLLYRVRIPDFKDGESLGLKFFGGCIAAGLTLTPAPLPGGEGLFPLHSGEGQGEGYFQTETWPKAADPVVPGTFAEGSASARRVDTETW